jgi:ubiquinone/menaquinone biosynthesis C-methylase UbiE
MDEPDADPGQLERSLRFIRGVNALFGYTRATIGHLERFSGRWERDRTIHLIDLATGSADVPRAILRWADRKGWDVRIVGVDRHAVTAHAAVQGASDPRLSIVQADVFDLPFEAKSFDYALTSMFLHHLGEEEVVRVMKAMDRLARRGVIIADLLRHRRAYAWITALTLFSNPMVRHDARVSVAQAFTKAEICALRDRAGLGFAKYYRHFGHRFVVAGER